MNLERGIEFLELIELLSPHFQRFRLTSILRPRARFRLSYTEPVAYHCQTTCITVLYSSITNIELWIFFCALFKTFSVSETL
jgi:hypothetical protein